MALAAGVLTRIQQAYAGAVKGSREWVYVSQSDMRAILLGNDAGDTVAAAYTITNDHGLISPDSSAA